MIMRCFKWFPKAPNTPVAAVAGKDAAGWANASDAMPGHKERGTFVVDVGSFKTVAFWRPVKGFMEFTDIDGCRVYYNVKRWIKLPD